MNDKINRFQKNMRKLFLFVAIFIPISSIAQSNIAPNLQSAQPVMLGNSPSASANQPPPPPTASEFEQWLQNNSPPPAANAPKTNQVATIPPPSGSLPVHRKRPPGGHTPPTYLEGQKIMLNSVPPSVTPQAKDADVAFNMMMQQNMPLNPEQVVKLRQQIDVSQRAAAIPANIPPKPVSSTIMINLAPGTTPPAIRLAQGYVSSLVFVDSTGSPWPIAAFDIGNPGALNVQWDQKSNIILMQAKNPYSYGDIVIRLVGLPTPITLELVSGQRVVDYRADIHVPGIGPNTKELPIGVSLPESANQLLLSVLDGVAPPGSRQLTVRGAVDTQAWLLGEKIYLRTRLTVLSPGWIGTISSPDGMQAYELPKTSSILVSRYGEPTELKLEGF